MALSPDSGPAIAAAFALPGGTPELTGPVAGGYQGLVWRLTTSEYSWAVKEALTPLDPGHVRVVAAYEEAVGAAGVFVPQPIRASTAEVVAEVDGAELRCYTWADLAEPDTGLDPAQLGRAVAAIHRVPFDYPGSADPWYSEPVGAVEWDHLIARATRARAPFAERLAAARDDLVAVERLLEPAAALHTCHRDLFADNVRRSGDRLCVFDWENCGEADPSMELAMVLFEYARSDPQRSRALYDGYSDAGGPGRIRGPGSFSMVIAVVHHIGEIGCRRWLAADPDDHAGRALNLGRVDEFLGDLLTVRMIGDLVEAIR